MSDETRQNTPKYDMLTPTQRVFVVARARGKSVAESAKDAGVARNTPATNWDMDLINEAILELQQTMFADASKALTHLLPGAIERLEKEIKKGGAVGLAAAREVFDRTWGKPVQRNEHSGPGGGVIPLQVVDYRSGLVDQAPADEVAE